MIWKLARIIAKNKFSAGGIFGFPNDERFGDIHFYNEDSDLWKDSSYKTPRCATEYGVQSLPSRFAFQNEK